ncbi:biotin-dependent carboxyltransferase family protein [Lishizhenia sp.]|uniref:5-oxoprolinase subunit C family protein n=1 Tax=Lishizhenia sp. TaxID=2497594 RepID=UPI00299F2542|nr:biotin-dependent carboxyltransferase family protein [Lishizhenia sp.]MDX1445652.1 biotin-dependent carboxyltransferase family protein [Lishizhenia sp.]
MLTFIKPGFYTSVQDQGRWKYRNKGIPTSGCMDDLSAQIANALVNNKAEDALLEITQIGPHMHFDTPAVIAFSGAQAEVKINGEKIELNKAYPITANTEVKVGYCQKGIRLYMAIKGGFQTPEHYGSRSWFEGVTQQSRCVAGDKLPYLTQANFLDKYGNVVVNAELFSDEIEVEPGPEFLLLGEEQREALVTQSFTIGNQNNRMGYQLEEVVKHNLPEILSSPVLPGTVQLTPSGKLIVLMKDSATSGGYPRILQLTELGCSKIAQKSTREQLHFKMKF